MDPLKTQPDQMPADYRTGSCFSLLNWQPAFCAVEQELMCSLWAVLIIAVEHFGVAYQFTTPPHPKLQLIRHLTQRKPRLFSPCHVRGGENTVSLNICSVCSAGIVPATQQGLSKYQMDECMAERISEELGI